MEILLERLSALDPGAESAVRAIAYFDALVGGRAGLEAFVRGAAVLTGCPAGLHDPDRHVHLRVHPDGHRLDPAPAEHSWPTVELRGTAAGVVWLERPQEQEAAPADAIVLERLAVGAGIVLDRTRGRAPAYDPASVETLLAAEAAPEARLHAARRLALPTDLRVRVLATMPPQHPTAEPGDAPRTRWSTRIGRVTAEIVPAAAAAAAPGPGAPADQSPVRTALGPAVAVTDLPRSWAGAVDTLRLTADGTSANPGPRHLCHDDLGALTAVAAHLAPADALVDDVRALREAETADPGSLAILAAYVEHTSLRQTATALHLHHSSLQTRLPRLHSALGYRIDTPSGRCRLHLALALHRIHLSGNLP